MVIDTLLDTVHGGYDFLKRLHTPQVTFPWQPRRMMAITFHSYIRSVHFGLTVFLSPLPHMCL